MSPSQFFVCGKNDLIYIWHNGLAECVLQYTYIYLYGLRLYLYLQMYLYL